MLLVGLACALVSLIGLCAVLPGRAFLDFDAVNDLAPFWLAGGLACGAWGLAHPGTRFRSAILVLAAVTVALQGRATLPELAKLWVHRSAGPPGVRVMTYNLWERNVDPAQSARAILESGADVVALPEELGRSLEVLPLLRAAYPYRADCLSNRWCSLAMVSKRPFLASRYHQGAWSGAFPDRLALVWGITLDRQGRPFTVAVTHFAHGGSDGDQASQRERLARALRRCRFPGMVLAGDFNTTPWSEAMRRQDRAFAPLTRRSLAIASWPDRLPARGIPMPAPFLPIDHVYAAPEWRTAAIRRGGRGGSDHYPVIVDLVRSGRASTVDPATPRASCADGGDGRGA